MRAAISILISLVLGLVFGLGLLLSGMTDTSKVLGFLDVAGKWQPALALVMGAGVLTAMPFFVLAHRRGRALNGAELAQPPKAFDAHLIIGAAIFGIGWGLAGLCPGPVLVWVGHDPLQIAPFVIAFFIGSFIAQKIIAAKALKSLSKAHEHSIQKA